MKHDLVEVIEAAYTPETDNSMWLAKVAAAARPALDRGEGVLAMFQDIRDPSRVLIGDTLLLGCADAHYRFSVAVQGLMGAPEIAHELTHVFRTFQEVLLEVTPEKQAQARELAKAHDFVDGASVLVADPTGLCLFLGAPFRNKWKPSRRDKVHWSRVAAHLAAGYRLQRHSSTRPPSNEVGIDEAIIDPGGQIQHAQGVAREADSQSWLRQAALAMERARTKLRREDPDEALKVWQGLVAGRWSLVDRFDNDGRRYLVARKNDPSVEASSPLTAREQQVVGYIALGHSNKLIAYELGLSQSNISERWKSARAKLGVRSRAELIQLLMGGHAGA